MIIEKRKNEYGSSDITLKKDGKVLSMHLGGDDPRLTCKYESIEKINEITFDIDESDEVYKAFETLYDNIVTGNVLNENPELESTRESMEFYKRYTWFPDIVSEGVITIPSDAHPINCPNHLKITKNEGKIILTFIQEDGVPKRVPKNKYEIIIGIRLSGSRIYEFSYCFKTLFGNLQTVEPKKEGKKLELK